MKCSLQPLPQYGEQGGKGGVGLWGWAWSVGRGATHEVQFSVESVVLSSISMLVERLAKPWGSPSHSSKRMPVPRE